MDDIIFLVWFIYTSSLPFRFDYYLDLFITMYIPRWQDDGLMGMTDSIWNYIHIFQLLPLHSVLVGNTQCDTSDNRLVSVAPSKPTDMIDIQSAIRILVFQTVWIWNDFREYNV